MSKNTIFFVLVTVLLNEVWSQSCPPGTAVVRCKADPCTVNSCPKYPNAECRANYCGGCNADFYLKGRKVDCEKGYGATTTNPRCPPAKPLVQCFADPCQVTTCPEYPNATCKSNYCGGCNAEFFVDGRKVNCGKQHNISTTTVKPLCPPGVHLVNCFANPCQVTKCPSYPAATCRPNYCGGCNAEFYVHGRRVDCNKNQATTPRSGGCPPDQPLVQCFDSPCLWTKCVGHPDAVCKPNYCGGCNAEFFVNGQKVSCVVESSTPRP